jgi:hypothetical protein
MLIYVLRWRPSWISDRHKKQKLCWEPSNDHSCAVWFQLTLWENVQMPSSQKLQIWLKPNCTWMFIGCSSTNFTFFVLIWNSKWRLRQDLFNIGPCIFPIWSCVNTMPCGGSHLGFPIGIKNRGPSNDHSWAVWFQRRSVLKHFTHRVQC